MAWTVIPDSDIDPDSPITTGLMTGLRDNFAALAAGDSGAPSFSGITGASMVLLSTQTASASATVDFTANIDGTYDKYIIKITNLVAATNATDLYMRLSQAGTFITGTSYYWSRIEESQSANNSLRGNGVGQFSLTNSLEATNARAAFNGEIHFSSPDNTAYSKHFRGMMTYESTGGNFYTSIFGGIHLDTTAMDGVRFLMSSGNIASGVFRLYGIKDS